MFNVVDKFELADNAPTYFRDKMTLNSIWMVAVWCTIAEDIEKYMSNGRWYLEKVTLDNEIQHLFPQYVEDFVVDRPGYC